MGYGAFHGFLSDVSVNIGVLNLFGIELDV